MPATYEPIATTTLGSAAAAITFSSISSAYTDLRLVTTGTSTGASDYNVELTFNSDTGANYSDTELRGNGTNITSSRTSGANYINPNSGALGLNQGISFFEIDIPSYAGSTNKTVLCSHSADKNGDGAVVRSIGLWRSTSAITSITFTVGGSTWATGTTATLYGILKA
jgi:hypothetical protein